MTTTKHLPEEIAHRVMVIDRDSIMVGSMPARVGMRLSGNRGEVVKVNEKSIVVRRPRTGDTREDGRWSVTLTEARRFGFPR